MKSKPVILISVICIIIATGVFFHLVFTDTISPENKLTDSVEPLIPEKTTHTVQKPVKKKELQKQQPVQSTITTEGVSEEPEIDTEPEEEIETVESLKDKITDIAVEYVEDIYLLDELVQESASEPQELWEGDWISIDDWKRRSDSFSVEKNDDGEFELIPEKDSIQSYSYNEDTKEFQWELDYYGKKIIHKARFISEDVMVLMKISGIKVSLDIYKRDAG